MKYFFLCLVLSFGAAIHAQEASLLDRSKSSLAQKETVDVSFHADYLFWQAQEDQLVYAVRTSDTPPLGAPQKIGVIEQGFEWGSGFRVGAGYRCPFRQWDIDLNWTHFCNPGSSSRSGADGDILYASLLSGAISFNDILVTAQEAKSTWDMNMNMLDLQLGRSLSIHKYFFIHPHIGIRGGWIHQKQRVIYQGLQGSQIAFVSSLAKVIRQNNWGAVGPETGIHVRWGKKIGVSASCSAAMLYGKFCVDTKYRFQTNPISQNGRFSDNRYRLRPMAQILLGLDWSQKFRNKWECFLRAGYETGYWWSQWQEISNLVSTVFIGGTPPIGDLLLQGVTVSAAFTF